MPRLAHREYKKLINANKEIGVRLFLNLTMTAAPLLTMM